MDPTWVSGAVSGASGVGGAAVGAWSTLGLARRSERERRKHEHTTALVTYYSAANQLGMLWGTIADVHPAGRGPFAKMRAALQTGGAAGHMLVARMFQRH